MFTIELTSIQKELIKKNCEPNHNAKQTIYIDGNYYDYDLDYAPNKNYHLTWLAKSD